MVPGGCFPDSAVRFLVDNLWPGVTTKPAFTGPLLLMSHPLKPAFANPEPATHHALALWAAACAERVLAYFEQEHPQDERPRVALTTLREWVRGERSMVRCRTAAFEAHDAARTAATPAAVAAARAAGQAAAVAHMYTHAPHAAAYALKAVELAAAPVDNAKGLELAWQLTQLRNEPGLRPYATEWYQLSSEEPASCGLPERR